MKMNWDLAWYEEIEHGLTAYWVKRNGKISGLRLPDLYGRDQELGISDLLGRFNADQLASMRRDLPVVDC